MLFLFVIKNAIKNVKVMAGELTFQTHFKYYDQIAFLFRPSEIIIFYKAKIHVLFFVQHKSYKIFLRFKVENKRFWNSKQFYYA